MALKKHRVTNTKEQEVTEEAAVHLITARHPQAASSVFSGRLQVVPACVVGIARTDSLPAGVAGERTRVSGACPACITLPAQCA